MVTVIGPLSDRLEGPAELIGDNPFALIGGTGAVWIRAGTGEHGAADGEASTAGIADCDDRRDSGSAGIGVAEILRARARNVSVCVESQQDLHHHVHLENNILFPRAIEMDESCR